MRRTLQYVISIGSAVARLHAALARLSALLLGGFALLNVLGGWARPGFDANIWWIDLRPLPGWAQCLLLLSASVSLLGFGVAGRLAFWRKGFAQLPVAILLAFALANSVQFYALVVSGAIRSAAPVPFSLFVTASLLLILHSLHSSGRRADEPPRRTNRRLTGLAMKVALCGVVLVAVAFAQMYCFGKTDYRRRADAIVVFGAGVYPDGRCSDALSDRMRTAISLYRQGYAGKLILSGGPGMGEVHETEGMRRMAIRHGVPPDAIELDTDGLNTRATVRNTAEMFDRLGLRRVLAVSHFYHLPRIKMTYRQAGREVFTVPADESYLLSDMPYYLAREATALWAYYLRALG